MTVGISGDPGLMADPGNRAHRCAPFSSTNTDTCSVPAAAGQAREAHVTRAVPALQEPTVQHRKVPARHFCVAIWIQIHNLTMLPSTPYPKGNSLKELSKATNKTREVLFLNYFIK